jgi:hypothetical protein
MLVWAVTSCGLTGRCQRFGESLWLHLHGSYWHRTCIFLIATLCSVVTQQLNYSVATYRRTTAHYRFVVVISRKLQNSKRAVQVHLLFSCRPFMLVECVVCFILRKD